MNPSVLQKLPRVGQVQGQYAVLSRLDGKLAWQFLVMPTEMSWNRSANYVATSNPIFPNQQYRNTEGWTLSIHDLPLSTSRESKNLTDYVAQLSGLLLPDADKLSPPVLLWKWGQRLLSPCMMTRFQKTEDLWNGDGELTSCKVSFSLLQVSDKVLVD